MDILILILCGLGLLFGGFILYGSYLNKKRNKEGKTAGTYKKPSSAVLNDPAKVSSKPPSAKWFAWFLYTVVIIAIGYWVFKAYSIGSSLAALAIIIFIVWAVFGARVASHIPRLEKLKYSPEKSEIVKVISKVLKVTGRFASTTYFVSFEFPDGTRKNFPMDVNQYNSVAENETGILTYKENKNDLMFINFQSQS